MLQTTIERDFRITIPEKLRRFLQIGDKLLVSIDKGGRILLIPEIRAMEILDQTAGMWAGRDDIPTDGVEYTNQLRQGRRLQELGIIDDNSI